MIYREVYPVLGDGLIKKVMSENIPLWEPLDNETKTATDIAFNNLHGNKEFTPFFESLSDEQKVSSVLALFKEKWTKLWNIYSVEYNILDAYIVNETGSNNKTNNRNKNMTHGHVISEEGTNSGSVTTDNTFNETVNDSVYAFNSSSASPSASSTTSDNTNNSETRDLEDTRETTHSGTDKEVNTDTENGSYTIKKTGNIGYATPQSMLKEELSLWGEPFFKQVFTDIVNFCMYQVY